MTIEEIQHRQAEKARSRADGILSSFQNAFYRLFYVLDGEPKKEHRDEKLRLATKRRIYRRVEQVISACNVREYLETAFLCGNDHQVRSALHFLEYLTGTRVTKFGHQERPYVPGESVDAYLPDSPSAGLPMYSGLSRKSAKRPKRKS